jgi:hypothetical protein
MAQGKAEQAMTDDARDKWAYALIEEFLAICRREIEKKSDADDVIAILRIVAKTIEDNPETVSEH